MYNRVLLTVLISLAATGCTVAGMDSIPGYEIIALATGIAACFIMALGFALTEKFHKQHLKEGTSRTRTWLFFSAVLLVFIFLMTCA
jgi:peptidoglycan biosynthesis protein MviN/MurJ (putative lipid II flippase)